ncbi:GDP-mannose 4,6-dehydratase [Chloroflexota bacterium]
MKRALITGITGQDGSYLAEYLISMGYEVHGVVRRASVFNTQRIDHISEEQQVKYGASLTTHYGDMVDSSSLNRILERVQPDEIYNLAAESHVMVSFEVPEYTVEADGVGVLRLLDSIRETGFKTRFYQASTSELFGGSKVMPQNEATPFYPRSPYAVAKLYAYWIAVNYREAYDVFTCNGILFNHESPRRGETFVTRKVTRAVARIKAGLQDVLEMGNLEARRDWGYAPEYVEMMWQSLQQDKPLDYVLGTGEFHSVREFIQAAFSYAGLDWEKHVRVADRYFRPTEADNLLADPKLAVEVLGWEPKIRFAELVKIMMDADLRAQGQEPVGEGDRIIAEKFPDRWWWAD